MPQLNRKKDERQQRIENDLARMGAALARLEHDKIRVENAIEVTGKMDLLGPILHDLDLVVRAIRANQQALRDEWEKGQKTGWNQP